MSKHVKGGVDPTQAEKAYKRIVANSLTVKTKYPGASLFNKKYPKTISMR